MRTIGITAISLAMAVPAAAASPAASPAAPVQGLGQPGRYTTEWGEATLTFNGRGGATIKFADGSEIWGNFAVGGGGRITGHWARARRAGGLTPPGTGWASRCDTGPSVLPAGFQDRRTPYWGTALVTLRAGEFTVYFNSCRGLPHSTGSQREGLHGKLLTRVGEYTPQVVRGLGPDSVLQMLRERRLPNCAAQPSAVALPSRCEFRNGTTLDLVVQRDLTPGYHVRFVPLVTNGPLIGDALHHGRRPPTRPGVAPVRLNPDNRVQLRRNQRITLQHIRDLCRSDIWLVEVVTARGGAYPYSGIVVTDCGPRDGTFAPSGPRKN